ncbi:MAG TPA: phage holin family protein [Nitrospiria bacterium]|jgi:putative membrane protein|nr:phage holin family protein [Nitrospiria bacterium]
MKGILIRWVINALALILVSHVIQGIQVDHLLAAFVAAAVLGVMNAVIRPVLILLTLPITLLTLGLFVLMINGFMLYIAGAVVKGFHVNGFWAAVFGSLFLSVISWIANAFINDRGRIEYIEVRTR